MGSCHFDVKRMARRYQKGVDWAKDRHWGCNDNAHPSRHGTYDGISMHPFETVLYLSTLLHSTAPDMA
jgi:hypothetical protein